LSERIVVCCRMSGEEVGRREARYFERARALTQHAEARGATLAAWSATTLAFAWDTESLEEAIDFACEVNGEDADEKLWGCALAQGALEPLVGASGRGRADLAWGEPLVAAVILARAARAGEILVEASFAGLSKLVVTGKRNGHDGDRRVRGVRVDARQPWQRDVGQAVERLVIPALLGRPDPRSLLVQPGLVHVLRADPGQGGTRMLTEIARAVAPGPTILVTPTGGSIEPLGALRRAVVRALAKRPHPEDAALDDFLAGVGATVDQASAFVAAILRSASPAATPGALLIDDAGDIDAESLEACAQVIAPASLRPEREKEKAPPFFVFVRIDATDQLPASLAALPAGQEVELGPLDLSDAAALARAATGGALGKGTGRRIARRAANVPLAIVEALAFGLRSGDIVWAGDRAALRTGASLAGRPAAAARWISKRAKATATDERGVLATIALLGGEAPLATVKDVLALVEPSIVVDDEVRKLTERHWLVDSLPGWVALPSRTHRDTIADLLDEARRRVLSGAIADVLEQNEGELGCAEAANHAVKGGDGERGARLALRAARAAQAAGMSKSASRLLTLARLADPKCEPLTRQQLLTSLPPQVAPPPKRARTPPLPASARPKPSVPVPRPAPPLTGDEPTTQLVGDLESALGPKRVAGGKEEADSDFPTVIDAPAYPAEPSPVQAETSARIDRPTEPDVVPAYVLKSQPPPRPPPPPRVAARSPSLRPGESPSGLPKPAAPLPLRRSVQSMPAAVSRPSDPAAPRVAAPARPSGQMGAVRPRAPPPVPLTRPPPPLVRPPPMPPASVAADSQAGAPSAPIPASAPERSASAETAQVAARMLDLVKSALIEGDAAGVDRWTEGLRAAGEHDRLAERIEAIGRLTRGQIGEALRSLRELRDASEASPSSRAQTSLALGLGLAAANRPDEALLAALDALARAREARDARAAGACLAFLSKLYGRTERREDAAALSSAAKA
jgi:hypothetical protein